MIFIIYDDLGKILKKHIVSSMDYAPVEAYIIIDNIDDSHIDINLYRVDISTKELVQLPIKPYDTSVFNFNTLQWDTDIKDIKNQINSRRLQLLQQSDWTDTVSAQTRLTNYEEWQTYRQTLRDITNQEGYPLNIVWPVQPGA